MPEKNTHTKEKRMGVTKGLIIDTPPIDRILSGKKTWEMRSSATQQRGRIALIRKGSGLVVGTVEIVGCEGPLNPDQMLAAHDKHMIDPDRIRSGEVAKWKYGWVLRNVKPLSKPVPYRHPSGAVIWVNLDPEVSAQLG